jgi:hypothetical protein
LPPIRNWPYQNGFTFSTWFRIEPVSGVNIEKEKPYFYWFGTNKGIGYTAYFMGSCLVLNYKTKVTGKEMQHCIQYDFKPREWYMITISHIYNRWSKSQVHCYVNGYHLTQVSTPFYIDATEVFDKCFIGCTPEPNNEMSLFSGQISAFYLYNVALDGQQIEAIFMLGPSYKNQFRFENESSHLHLSPENRRVLYDGKLTASIVFMYNPVNCDSQLLLQSAPKANQAQYFVHNAHALMLNDVKAVKTNSIYSILLSIGGMQVFYVLFGQIDYKQLDDTVDYNVCHTLVELICEMIQVSYNVQIQMINTKGILAMSYVLEMSSRDHINLKVLDSFLNLIKFLVQLGNPNGTILLKQLLDHILFNPAIWIYCSVEVQTKLYSYLATEFVNDLNIYINIRRISAVIQIVHALKYYYWIVDPIHRSGYESKAIESKRPKRDTIIQLRAYMLLYLKELVIKENGVQSDELQALLNYLHTVHENENIIDVLKLVVTLMNEHPPSMIPAFDSKVGIRTVLKLLTSQNETVRLQTLKLLGFFLQKSTIKRKTETLQAYNVFGLIGERLLVFASNGFSLSLYNTLYEIMVEKTTNHVVDEPHTDPIHTHHIENPLVIKIITSLIRACANNNEQQSMRIKTLFLNDLIILCEKNRDNRRTVLQMSVWQEFLIGLAYVYPGSQEEADITELVFRCFKILLHHALKHEYGGWRVWIDTLSILHSKVSKKNYQLKMNKLQKEYENEKTSNETLDEKEQQQQQQNNNDESVDKDKKNPIQLPPFRTPEFKWSLMHKRLLTDILQSIEEEIDHWLSLDYQVKTVIESVNNPTNSIFCMNTTHIISQLADILTNACGGLLPLLASATTVNTNDIEIMENTEGMEPREGIEFLERIMNISDIIILCYNGNFNELEQEKNLPSGAIIRQALRLTFTFSVRNCLEFRKISLSSSSSSQLNNNKEEDNDNNKVTSTLAEILNQVKSLSNRDPVEALVDIQLNNYKDRLIDANDQNDKELSSSKSKFPECLLQNVDIFRLKAIIYRDVTRNDKNKAKPYVTVVSILSFLLEILIDTKRPNC